MNESDGDKHGSRSVSQGSGLSRRSPNGQAGQTAGTRLLPQKIGGVEVKKEDAPIPTMRRSTGEMAFKPASAVSITLPVELANQPTKPLTVPLSMHQDKFAISASTGHELIANNLGAMEEKKGPERQWVKINKYAAFGTRGFGTFTPTFGRDVHG